MTMYEVKLLTSDKVPTAPNGLRGVRLTWKNTKNSKALSPKRYVHVQVIDLGAEIADGSLASGIERQLVESLVLDAQDSFIHQLVSYQIENGTFTGTISEDSINLTAMAKDAQASKRGQGKLTKEMVEQWFNEVLYEPLGLYVLEKQDGDEAKSEIVMKNYLGYFQKLSSPAWMPQVSLAKKLLEVLNQFVPEDARDGMVYNSIFKKLTDNSEEKLPEDFGL